MIKKLVLSNFILIDELEIDFHEGFNVITGETGAGKSILMGAIDLVLGSKLKGQVAYNQQKPVYIQADFSIDKDYIELMQLIDELELDISEDELFFIKKINTQGKATSYLNGIRVTNSTVSKFRELLIDFHSQNDQQQLLRQDYQLDILDSYANLIPLRENYNNELKNLKELDETIASMQAEELERREKLDLYKYQINELESFGLREGEDSELESEIELLSHAEDIIRYSRELYSELYEVDNSIYDRLQTISGGLNGFRSDNAQLVNLQKTLNEALIVLEELATASGEVPESIDNDPGKLEEISLRLNSINELKSKYKLNSIELIIDYYNSILAEVNHGEDSNKQIEVLCEQRKSQIAKVIKLGDKLTKQRAKFSTKLSNELQVEIRKLAMPDSRFQIIIDKKDKLPSTNSSEVNEFKRNGFDAINFYFSSNKGIATKLLKNAVSGGELSRVMLAVKKVLSGYLRKRLLIFDEIDSGIGGKTADTISGILLEMSKYHQILCITHLPQIASVGANHLHISKDSSGKKTMTVIHTLEGKNRIDEIARMLSGIESSIAYQHAEELLIRNKWSQNGN